jgi:hypothetical protein
MNWEEFIVLTVLSVLCDLPLSSSSISLAGIHRPYRPSFIVLDGRGAGFLVLSVLSGAAFLVRDEASSETFKAGGVQLFVWSEHWQDTSATPDLAGGGGSGFGHADRGAAGGALFGALQAGVPNVGGLLGGGKLRSSAGEELAVHFAEVMDLGTD